MPRSRSAPRKPSQRDSVRLSREQRATEILDHARAVFCEKGYADALVSEIAERAGVVEGSVFHYFPTKRELLIRAVEHWYTVMITGYDEQLDQISGTWNRLRFMIWGHLRNIHDEPEIVKLIINEIRPRPEYRETSIFVLNREYTRRTLSIIDEGVASGEFRNDCPKDVVRSMIYGGVEHYAFAFLRGAGDFSPDAAADAITSLIYRGLANDGVAQAGMLRDPIAQIESGLARLKDMAAQGAAPAATPKRRRVARSDG